MYVLSLIGSFGIWPKWEESGRMAMVTVCDVAIARRLPFEEIESCRIGSAIGTLRTYESY